MTSTTTLTAPHHTLTDEHSVLVWQTCAYADDLIDTARSPRPLTPAFDRMLGFLHYRLLPYLGTEERQLTGAALRDEHLGQVLLTDHDRLRADVENVESAHTRRLLTMSASALVTRLDKHVRREETWVAEGGLDQPGGVLPVLLADEMDLDVLPADVRVRLALGQLRRMRRGDSVRLHAREDLQPLWRRLHRAMPGDHAWVYEQEGPEIWVARITRRQDDGA